MVKSNSIYSFILVLLLVGTLGVMIFQSEPKFSGFVTNSEGVECDGNWTNFTSECINGTQTITWNSSDTTNCTSPIISIENCTSTCTENWTCESWTNCSNQTQYRNCSDVNLCNLTIVTESQNCTSPIACVENCTSTCTENWACESWTNCSNQTQYRNCSDVNLCNLTIVTESQNCTSVCVEDWDCTSWSECENEIKTRTCEDLAGCGTTEDKPSLTHSCTMPVVDTALVQEEPIQEVPQEKEIITTCTPKWECKEWQGCLNGSQKRECTDLNNCKSKEGLPQTIKACEIKPVVKILANCSDSIQNQNETGIDCGGECNKCAFLTILGSVITESINTGKNFVVKEIFGTPAKLIIFLIVISVLFFAIVIFKILKNKKTLPSVPLDKKKSEKTKRKGKK